MASKPSCSGPAPEPRRPVSAPETMEAAAAANLAARPGGIVIGDPGTGKSSLVVAIATEQFPENVPKVMPHTRLPPTTSPTASPSPSSTPPPEAEADRRVPGRGHRRAHLCLRQALHAREAQHLLATGAQAHPAQGAYHRGGVHRAVLP
nr:uncharacterized protein LOC127295409 [Lolium perenne]